MIKSESKTAEKHMLNNHVNMVYFTVIKITGKNSMAS